MKVQLFSIICLDEDEYPDLNLYRHFIDHYKSLGIKNEHFNIIPCGVDSYKENFEKFKNINSRHNIPTLELLPKKYDIKESHKIYLNWRDKLDPEEWVIRPDPDEFNDYGPFDKIQDCVQYLEENNYQALQGELMDCVAEDLVLHKVQYPENLFMQFPIRANITKFFINSLTDKLLLFKAKVEFQQGHHHVVWNPKREAMAKSEDIIWDEKASISGLKIRYNTSEYWNRPPSPTPGIYETNFKAFHFKWTDVLVRRLENTQHKNLYISFDEDRKTTNDIIKGNKFNIVIKEVETV